MSDEQWWIVTFGDMLHWARLTMNEDGNAEVLSANGETERFPNEGEARVALLDANYREFDGIDDDDAEEMGSSSTASLRLAPTKATRMICSNR
ncbi:MAG: hypothetical protein IPH50_06835 [Rhodanobacteraceae bacterium]|nr:hypothetical protein [Rhodanobacteraceae bacterium]